jgi:hypothetical protein
MAMQLLILDMLLPTKENDQLVYGVPIQPIELVVFAFFEPTLRNVEDGHYIPLSRRIYMRLLKVFLNVGRDSPIPTSAPTIQPPTFSPVAAPSDLLEPPSNYPLSLRLLHQALLEPPLLEHPLVQNAVASSASVFFARSPSVVFLDVLLGLSNNLKINIHPCDSSFE